jgi:hypothetical protein
MGSACSRTYIGPFCMYLYILIITLFISIKIGHLAMNRKSSCTVLSIIQSKLDLAVLSCKTIQGAQCHPFSCEIKKKCSGGVVPPMISQALLFYFHVLTPRACMDSIVLTSSYPDPTWDFINSTIDQEL